MKRSERTAQKAQVQQLKVAQELHQIANNIAQAGIDGFILSRPQCIEYSDAVKYAITRLANSLPDVVGPVAERL